LVDHGVGVAGPGPVVAFCVRAEGLGNPSVTMRLVFERRVGGHAPIVVGMRRLINRIEAVGNPSPAPCPYSPECVEDEFSEVHSVPAEVRSNLDDRRPT
jgi:hypothetical protein